MSKTGTETTSTAPASRSTRRTSRCRGVKADGSYVTSSADVAATLLSNFGAGDADTFRINPTATGFTLNGLGIDEPFDSHFAEQRQRHKALISFRADNVTITNSVFATGKASYAIEINGNAVTKYTIEGNQIGAPIWLLGGAGNGGGDEIVRGNTFFGVGSDGVQSGIYVMGGKVAGYAPEHRAFPAPSRTTSSPTACRHRSSCAATTRPTRTAS